MRRGFEPRRGHWSMPGGFVDLGESVEDAAIREVQEELNLRIEITHLIGVYSRAEDRTVVVVYAATARGTPSLTEEALEVRAFAPIDIPWQDLAFWSDESALRDHLKAAACLDLAPRKGRRPPEPAAGARARSSSSPPRSPAATSRSSATTTTPSCRSARSGCRSIRATAARSTSTSRWWTGARASRRSGRRSASASTCRRSTATSPRAWPRASRSTSSRSATRPATRSRPT